MASMPDVARAAAVAGWGPADLPTAVAVAWATSGGDTTHPGGVWGLSGAPGGPDDAARLSAQAGHAHGQWTKDGWGQFPGHKGNRWLLYLPAAGAAIEVAGGAAAVQQAGGAASKLVETPAQLALEALRLPERVLAWLTDTVNVGRLLKVVIGGALVVGGVYLLARVQILEPAGEKVAGVLAGGKVKAATAVAAKGKSGNE